jgi:hypothetical protein
MMIKLLAMLAVLASVQGSTTPLKPPPGEPRQIAEDAMKFVAAEDMKGLFAFIATHMPMDRAALDKIRDSSIEQRKKLPPALGKLLGTGFIRECRLTDYLARIVYVEKREKNVIRWQFIFYKARTTWTISSFIWDENVNDLFAPCA